MTAFFCCVWIDKFNKNIFLTVSTKSNNSVVQELRQELGSQELAFQNEDIAFNSLQVFLKETGQNPLLLILDDVWPESESLLDKFDELSKRSNCSILVTSRSSFPRFGSPYALDALNDKDAMTLFRYSAVQEGKNYPEGLQKKVISESIMHNIFAYLLYRLTKYPIFMLAHALKQK